MPEEGKTYIKNYNLKNAESKRKPEGEHILPYCQESDEQLYQRIRDIAAELGRLPTKSEIPDFAYFKSRLGNWPRIMEQAGLKPVSERRRRMMEKRMQERKERARKKGKGEQ